MKDEPIMHITIPVRSGQITLLRLAAAKQVLSEKNTLTMIEAAGGKDSLSYARQLEDVEKAEELYRILEDILPDEYKEAHHE